VTAIQRELQNKKDAHFPALNIPSKSYCVCKLVYNGLHLRMAGLCCWSSRGKSQIEKINVEKEQMSN
jgi:hypothetical protein